jgi:integrase
MERRPLQTPPSTGRSRCWRRFSDVAVEYELIDSNPARGRRRRLTANRPARAYLDSAAQIAALLAAAAELDNEARPDRKHVARRPLLATLVFAGLRIGELLELRWSDVSLASGWISVQDAKTPAGVRKVKIRPALREELGSYKAGASHTGPKSFVFGTSQDQRQSSSNVRSRVLRRSVQRANERLERREATPLPTLTPHGLRRSFASLLYAIGEPPPVVMAELGHTDPGLALPSMRTRCAATRARTIDCERT